MGSYYLFSDFSEEKGFSLLENEFKKDINNFDKIVFIASCPSSGEITDMYSEKYIKWFERINIHFKNKVVLDNRMKNTDMVNEIENASLIFLMGGTTSLQMKFLQNEKLLKPIQKSRCVVMGLSAGAINMGKISVLTKSSGHEKEEVYKGIGLTSKSVIPHFTLDKFDDELKDLSFKHSMYAMCDESAIIIRNDKCIYYGSIYLLEEGKIKLMLHKKRKKRYS